MTTELEFVEKMYVTGSDGYLVTLKNLETGEYYQGWGLQEDSTLQEIWSHTYAVYTFDSETEYKKFRE